MSEAKPTLLLVDSSVLPEVFVRVVEAKKMLATGAVKSYSEAAKQAGISRSALYKYKDSVFTHNVEDGYVATLNCTLMDHPGVLSTMINKISAMGANILTVNQNIPVDGVAPVSISIRADHNTEMPNLVEEISKLTGVVEAKLLSTR